MYYKKNYMRRYGLLSEDLAEVNDRYLQNIGYLRLKNLTLGYSLPKKWMDAIHMQKIRIFFSGENLLTFTSLKSRYIDPEQAGASNATVSSLATTLGWDTAIWDLSSAEPALR